VNKRQNIKKYSGKVNETSQKVFVRKRKMPSIAILDIQWDIKFQKVFAR